MGFFEWLETPQQQDSPTYGPEATPQELEASKKKKPKTLAELKLDEERHGMAVKGLQTDTVRANEDLRNTQSSAAAALDVLPGSVQSQGKSPFRTLSDDTLRQIGTLRKAINGKEKFTPLVFADDFERLANNKELTQQERDRMAGVASMFRRASQRQDWAEGSRQKAAQLRDSYVTPSAAPEVIEQAKSKVDALKKQEDSLRKNLLSLGVTNPQREGVMNAIAETAKERETAERDIGKFGQAPQVAPPSNDDPDKALNSVGVSRNDFVGSVADAAKKLQNELGPGFNLYNPVSFVYALPLVISALGPEAQVEFVTWARQEIARKRKEEGDSQKKAEAGSKGAAGPAEVDPYRAELRGKIEGNFARQQQIRQEISNAQEFQSWPAVIAYAILSVLIGPRGAFVFFSNAKRKNTLGLWLDQLKAEMGDLQRQEDYERRDQEWNRREAARQSVRQAEREDDFQKDMRKEIMRHYLIKERANQRGVDTSTTKKISSDFSRYATLADDARAEITQQDKILESLTASDPMKRNAAKVKESARQQLEQYKEKMRQINELLESGEVPAPVAAEGQE